MAIATGLVCGMFIFAPIGVPTGGILGVLLGQVVVFSYFFGKRRGKFEFQYVEYQRKTEIMNAIVQHTGYVNYFRHFLSEIGEISWSKGEKYQSFLIGELDSSKRFLLLYKLGILAKKDRNYEKAISYFDQSLEIKPSDLLSSFILAQCYERQGAAEKAINSYQIALSEGTKLSNCLRQYINAQIERVVKKGPSKKPPIPGLMHSGLGR